MYFNVIVLLFACLLSGPVFSEELLPIYEPDKISEDEKERFDALQAALADKSKVTFVEKGWPNLDLIWNSSSIPVCWESVSDDNKWYRSLVRQAVVDTWESHSSISFSGWEKCVQNNRGIRIAISDQGPHTKGLGTLLDGKKNGMILNASYNNWSPSCQNKLTYCSYVIAVHEFGHALGLAHDQNRPDTPEHCDAGQGSRGSPEAVSWTPWDEKSVMNYCNPEWSNGGKLSKWDIYTLQRLYGKP